MDTCLRTRMLVRGIFKTNKFLSAIPSFLYCLSSSGKNRRSSKTSVINSPANSDTASELPCTFSQNNTNNQKNSKKYIFKYGKPWCCSIVLATENTGKNLKLSKAALTQYSALPSIFENTYLVLPNHFKVWY